MSGTVKDLKADPRSKQIVGLIRRCAMGDAVLQRLDLGVRPRSRSVRSKVGILDDSLLLEPLSIPVLALVELSLDG
jgi:hypothetical protein